MKRFSLFLCGDGSSKPFFNELTVFLKLTSFFRGCFMMSFKKGFVGWWLVVGFLSKI